MSDTPVRTDATVYIPREQLDRGAVEVTGDLYRHLFRARRLAVGARLRVVDGVGNARRATVASVGRDKAALELGGSDAANEPALRLTLVVAAPRPERASWLVEKATELGVGRIAWLGSERTPRRFGDSVLERHRRVAVAAMQQCGRACLPAITGPHSWDSLADLLAEFDACWRLDPAGAPETPTVTVDRSAALWIGPEGGWTDEERRHLDELGCAAWSLGSRILRVETAALVGAALLLHSPR